jgi:hypothetical protein
LFGEPVTLSELRLLLVRQQETGPAFAGMLTQLSKNEKLASKQRGV